MSAKPFVTAVIAAGGKGVRMGGAAPKQFLSLGGEPVLARTARVFEDSPEISEIILVAPEGYAEYAAKEIAGLYGFRKCREIVSGGAERTLSVYEGIRRASAATEILVVHDGVRPFTSAGEIAAVVAGAGRYGACAPAVRLKDALKLCAGGFAESTPDKDRFRLIQTPQAFRFELIKRAYERALEEGLAAGDDAALAEALGVKTFLIDGNYGNIKITTKEDMIFAEAMIKNFYA